MRYEDKNINKGSDTGIRIRYGYDYYPTTDTATDTTMDKAMDTAMDTARDTARDTAMDTATSTAGYECG